MTNKENRIDFEKPDGSEISGEEFSGKIVASEWTTLPDVEGVRFKAWKYENVSDEIVDGALVEVMPGQRTPVQYVETDHVFDENIQRGKFLLLHLTKEGFSAYKYDSSIEEVSFSLQIHQGEVMCLYVLKENAEPGEIIECEQPGFSLANLVTVEQDTKQIGDLIIPDEFWQTIKKLDNGDENDLPINIVDISEEA